MCLSEGVFFIDIWFLGWQIFSFFVTLKVSLYCFLACKISKETTVVILFSLVLHIIASTTWKMFHIQKYQERGNPIWMNRPSMEWSCLGRKGQYTLNVFFFFSAENSNVITKGWMNAGHATYVFQYILHLI